MRNVLLGLAAAVGLSAGAAETKIVSFAWEWARTTPAELLELQPQIAAAGIDGVNVAVTAKTPQGAELTYRTIMQAPKWEYAYFADQLPLLRRLTKMDGLRESYLSAFRMPEKRFSWTDDAEWKLAAENIRVIARLAKEAGFAGLVIDHEDYPKQKQFFRRPGDPEMKDLVRIARRRGRETFAPVFEEFPDVKLLFFWFMSENRNAFDARNPLKAAVHGESLWPFFANGILDAMTPDARIIDGNETSYAYRSEDFEYHVGTQKIRKDGIGLALPENRETYRTKVLAGSALYLEQYVQTNTASMFYRPPHLGTRLGTFQRDLRQAMESSDGTIWFWSEKTPLVRRDEATRSRATGGIKYWWDNVWGNPTMEERLPGFGGVIRALRDPGRFLQDDLPRMIAAGKVTNLVADGGVAVKDGDPEKCPSPFDSWQEVPKGGTAGTFSVDPKVGCAAPPCVRVRGVSNGCLIYRIKVRPAEIYAIRVRLNCTSGGFGADVGWTRQGAHRFYVPKQALDFGAPDAHGWRTGTAIVTVPEGVDGGNLYISGLQGPDDEFRVDDLEVYRLY